MIESSHVREWCGVTFAPTSPGQKFCCSHHKAEAKRQRRAQGDGASLVAEPLPERICAWCKVPFVPNDPVQMFCKTRHAKNARIRRREMEAQGTLCPRPDKRAYSTEAPAVRAVKAMDRDDLEAYQCICGHWHVGSIPEWMAAKRLIAKQLAS